MADQSTELKVQLRTEGLEKLRSLTNAVKKLQQNSVATGSSTRKLLNDLKTVGNTSIKSKNRVRELADSYRELANNVDVTSREFREANREARRLDRQLARMEKRKSIGGRIVGAGRTLGAVAAAGVFGGVEGLAGATIGGVLGGTPGALVGGGIGAGLSGTRRALGEIGSYNAALRQQKFALQLVIKDTEKFEKAQEFLAQTSEKLAIPQDVIVRQFTSLTASVTGAGKSVEDAQEVFLSIASGIRGTGGSLEDMRSAMVATAQVFSKGKVSAEELRQQLGERLPGAFTLFAASMGKTPAELDKALEQGKVTLDDFLGFSKHLFKNYGKNAEILASSPAAAGDRLATEFSKLKENFGGLFANIGANVQDFTTKIFKFLNDNEEQVKETLKNIGNFVIGSFNVIKKVTVDAFNFVKKIVIGFGKIIIQSFQFVTDFINGSIDAINKSVNSVKDIPIIGNVFKDFKEIENITLKDTFEGLTTFLLPITKNNTLKNYGEDLKEVFDTSKKLTVSEFFEPPEEYTRLLNESISATDNLNDSTKDLKSESSATFINLKNGAQGYLDTIKDVGKQIQDAFINAFKGMEDAFVNFVMTGKLNFRDLARSMLADMARIIVRQRIMMPLMKGVSGLFNLGLKFNEKGNAFGANGIIPYAKGGIVNKPTIFPFANGIGLMGEAGAEAILPLKRGRSGNLGVEASGSSNNIVVNVDASGSSVQGNTADAQALGVAIGAAIQAQLIKEKRPGGLLTT